MNNKKLIAILMTATLAVSSLTGCGVKETGNEKNTESAVSKETVSSESKEVTSEVEEGFDPRKICEGVKITIAAPENLKVKDYNTNVMTLEAEEALGLDIEFVTYASADYKTKLEVMVQGGTELPDILLSPGKANVPKWAEAGALIDLTEYYDDPDFSANIRAGEEDCGQDITSLMKSADGKIYGIPLYAPGYSGESWDKFWIYEPWLEALGEDMPTTIDEFYELCKLVANTDLNGNGKKDEIPLAGAGLGYNDKSHTKGWFSGLMSSFIYAFDSEWRVVEDGKISYAYTTDEWKEGLKYIKKFIDEGLILKDSFVLTNEQWEAIAYQEDTVLFAFSNARYRGTDYETGRNYSYMAPLVGPDGVQYSGYRPETANVGAVITADCKNPDAAFLLLDFWCQERYGIMQRFGEEGVDWDYWENAQIENKDAYGPKVSTAEISIVTYDDAGFWNGDEPVAAGFRQTGPLIRAPHIVDGWATLQAVETDEDIWNKEIMDKMAEADVEAHKYFPEEAIVELKLTTDETASISDITTVLNSYVPEITAAFLTGEKDIDKDWDAYLAELEKIGYKNLLNVYQTAYDRAK